MPIRLATSGAPPGMRSFFVAEARMTRFTSAGSTFAMANAFPPASAAIIVTDSSGPDR